MPPKKSTAPVHKLIMVGPGGVGKSALTLQFMYAEFVEEYEPTKADSYRKLVSVAGEQAHIDILDTAGQEEYSAIRDNYYRSGEGFFCVFSLLEPESLARTREFRDQIGRVLDDDAVPFILVGNKADMGDQRKVSRAEGQAVADQFGCPYYEVSAKLKINVSEAFVGLAEMIAARKASAQPAKPAKKRNRCILL